MQIAMELRIFTKFFRVFRFVEKFFKGLHLGFSTASVFFLTRQEGTVKESAARPYAGPQNTVATCPDLNIDPQRDSQVNL